MTQRLVLLVLAVALAGCPPPPPPDFRTLAEKAYPEGGATPDKPALDKLWSSLFRLPKWYLLADQNSIGKQQPSVTWVDGEQWVIVFTDVNFLGLYAGSHRTLLDGGPVPAEGAAVPSLNVFEDGGVANKLVEDPTVKTTYRHLGKDGQPLVIALSPNDAVKLLEGWQGPPIKGVRFNEGTRKGWFAPVSALPNIRGMLKENGKL